MLLSILRKASKLLLVYLLFANSVYASILDAKFSTAQIFDVQWYISNGRLYASGFNYIYSSVNYATQTTSAARWTAAQTADASSNGRYIAFFNSTTNPGTYGMAVYNSNGTVYKIINNTGSFRTLADGAIFYNGNNMWGTLITTKQGYSLGSSGSFTITQQYPTNAQLQAYTPDSTTPLAAGQTAAPPPAAATPVYASSITNAQQTRKSAALNGILGHSATVSIAGDSNDIYIQQAVGKHVVAVDVSGNTNTVNILQTGQGYTGVQHYLEVGVNGSNNTLNINQKDTSKTAFVSATGNYNSATVLQQGTGNHYLQLDLIGNGHTAAVTQSGTGSHAATVALTNGGGAWNFSLTQNSSTAQTYSLPHTMSDNSVVSGTCSVAAGCNLTVNQQ